MVGDDVLAIVRPTMAHRIFGTGALSILGLFLIWIMLTQSQGGVAWQLFLAASGTGALWLAMNMWRATGGAIELTREVLRTSDGEIIAKIADIASLDRGMFAVKPSNGFTIRLKAGSQSRWKPGLWWRLGRWVGVGGVTSGSQTRAMAHVIYTLMKENGS
ncbi:MAG: hypothetical protein OXC72_14290 [Roseovarius sp.]|nr:hypothetical protein [Roseovarius sp.]MCY4292906.1 hypothetical protein [Roseovarius sp.]MCY4316164.1 hypothetical protein [Roseovarius sp.]